MTKQKTLSRRSFLKGAATAAAASCAPLVLRSFAQTAPSSREKLFQFGYTDVRLTGGPLKAQFDRIHPAYLALDEDRLLKVFRQRAGLPAPGKDMGGWYDADAFGPGHSFGQYVSGLARFAKATGDAATQAKARRLTEGFIATIDPDGYAYASVRASTAFPAYTLDKNLIGMLDAYQFAGVTPALDAAKRITKGAVRYLPDRPLERDEMPKHAPYDEAYTLPENFFYAYELTGDSSFLDLAKQFLFDRRYYEPLSRGNNVLPGTHAYSHVNCLSSGARAYLHLGNPMHLQAIRNAWDMIEAQQFASGGWGPDEAFVTPGSGKLGESLTTTRAHFETPCGAYAHFKLARYLLRITGESRYADGMERVLYNTVLGAKDPSSDGRYFYYSDYQSDTKKGYHPDKWPCCSGTLPQAVCDYLLNIYMRSAEGIYVNLYVPSEVKWKAGDTPVRMVQTTAYPESDSSELRLEIPSPSEFTVFVRVPGWLKSPAVITVNDKPAAVAAAPGTFAAIRRRWQHNDTIQVTLPFTFRPEAIDEQHRDTVALMRGPLMLVALDPKLEIPRSAMGSPDGLKPSSFAKQSFELQQGQRQVRFVPFYTVGEETYTTYFTAT
jgi:DUF1680 family protein